MTIGMCFGEAEGGTDKAEYKKRLQQGKHCGMRQCMCHHTLLGRVTVQAVANREPGPGGQSVNTCKNGDQDNGQSNGEFRGNSPLYKKTCALKIQARGPARNQRETQRHNSCQGKSSGTFF